MSGRIQIDLWGGDLHQNLVDSRLAEGWDEAARIIRDSVEGGLLANVLHLDFKTPEERLDEMNAAIRAALQPKETDHE